MVHWNNTLIITIKKIVELLLASVLNIMQFGDFLQCLCQDDLSISVCHLPGFSGLLMEPHRITQGYASCVFQMDNNRRFSFPEYMCPLLLILAKH